MVYEIFDIESSIETVAPKVYECHRFLIKKKSRHDYERL